MDKLSSHNVTISLPSHYDNAPLCALSGTKLLRLGGATRANAIVDTILAGGLDGIGGLHELIRWSAAQLLVSDRASEQDRADARVWQEHLGNHTPPHVVRDARGRVISVRYDD